MDNEYFLNFIIFFLVFSFNSISLILMTTILKIRFIKSFILSSTIGFSIFCSILLIFEKNFLSIILNTFFYFQLTYILLIIFYTPISSVRFNTLKILYENNFQIKKEKFYKLYNNNLIFYKRFKRLKKSKSISKIGNEYYINSIKIKIMLNFFFPN